MTEVQTFHRYRLIRRIARGGMAEVYLAAHRGFGDFERRVALKKILPVYSGMDEFSGLFQDEARISAALDHSGIVQVHDFGQHEGEFYIAMEYVDGPDLEEVLDRCRRRGILPPVEAVLHIGHRLAACLEYAHSRRDAQGRPLNIVHRDVSPPNVLIGIHGEIKLTDFGVARADIRNIHTRPGVLRGKYAYMSPEQVRHEPIDHRSDLFSLGTVLYEALTGVNPFEGSTDYQTMESVGQADVEPAGFLRPDTPAELDRILITCLEPEPGDRYAHAGELRRDLGSLMLQFRRADEPQVLVDFLRDVFPERASNTAKANGTAGVTPAWEGLAHRLSPMLVPIPARLPGSTRGPLRLSPRTLLDQSGPDFTEAARPDQPTWPGRQQPAVDAGLETAEMKPAEVLEVFEDAGLDDTDPGIPAIDAPATSSVEGSGLEATDGAAEAEQPPSAGLELADDDGPVTDPGAAVPTPPAHPPGYGPHGTRPGSQPPAPPASAASAADDEARPGGVSGSAPEGPPSADAAPASFAAAPEPPSASPPEAAPAEPPSPPPRASSPSSPPAVSAPVPAPVDQAEAPAPVPAAAARVPSRRRASPVFREVGPRGRKDGGLPGFLGVPARPPSEPAAAPPGRPMPGRPMPGFFPLAGGDNDRSSPGLPVPILGQEEPEADPIQPEPALPPPMGSLIGSDPLLRGLRRPPPTTDQGVPFVNEWSLDDADFSKTQPSGDAYERPPPLAEPPPPPPAPSTDDAIDAIWDGGPDPEETLDESLDEDVPGLADDSADSWDISTPSSSAEPDELPPSGGTVPSGEAFSFGSSFAPSDLQVLGGIRAIDEIRGETQASAPDFASAMDELAEAEASTEPHAADEPDASDDEFAAEGRSWSPWLLLLLLVPVLALGALFRPAPAPEPVAAEQAAPPPPARRVEPLEPVGARPAAQPPPARKRDE